MTFILNRFRKSLIEITQSTEVFQSPILKSTLLHMKKFKKGLGLGIVVTEIAEGALSLCPSVQTFYQSRLSFCQNSCSSCLRTLEYGNNLGIILL